MISIGDFGRERNMEEEEVALAVVRNFLKSRKYWERDSRRGEESKVWASNRETIFQLMGESSSGYQPKGGSASTPRTSITIHQDDLKRTKIFGIRILILADPAIVRWLFVLSDEDALQFVEPNKGVTVGNDGKITIADGSRSYDFQPDHVVWPWPVVDPKPFYGLARVDSLLANSDSNALSGLLRSASAETRTLANQIKEELRVVKMALSQHHLASFRT